MTHPLNLSQSIAAQSGLHVAIKWGLGTAESVFSTRLVHTFHVKPKKNLDDGNVRDGFLSPMFRTELT